MIPKRNECALCSSYLHSSPGERRRRQPLQKERRQSSSSSSLAAAASSSSSSRHRKIESGAPHALQLLLLPSHFHCETLHCTALTLALFLSLIGSSNTVYWHYRTTRPPTDRLTALHWGSMEVNKKRRVPLLSPSLPPSSLESLPSPSASCFSMHESWSDPKRNTDTRSSDVIRRRRRISSFLSCSSPPSTPLQSSVTE